MGSDGIPEVPSVALSDLYDTLVAPRYADAGVTVSVLCVWVSRSAPYPYGNSPMYAGVLGRRRPRFRLVAWQGVHEPPTLSTHPPKTI